MAMDTTISDTPPRTLPSTSIVPLPVCIGDLSASHYGVSSQTITFEVVKYLRDHEEVPGVLIYSNHQLKNMIPRLRMFERLGQMYGTDLFIRKPIEALCLNLSTQAFCLPEESPVDDAIQAALARPLHNAFDPVVCLGETSSAGLIDMQTLLLMQSRILQNMNNCVSILDRLRLSLSRKMATPDAANLVLDSINEIIPNHHASVSLFRDNRMFWIAGRGISKETGQDALNGKFLQSLLFQNLVRFRQSIVLDNIDRLPHNSLSIGNDATRCWMGAPLFFEMNILGLITLSRRSRTPFKKNEKDLLDAFARLFSAALHSGHLTDRE